LGRVGQLLLLGGIDEWRRLPTSLPGTPVHTLRRYTARKLNALAYKS
jgi:hypothetical protein